ncbi:carboxylating nicotinate-nucleotide diphosphorylase [Limisalsivibrio acetivorans]|uniref:carboxylating nicotinate-nucleotide diphosphorylase n=1 Tax=Limisalsivibrio acetivorans TaxID=1304888 RepID=UPI0003B4514F|nr:carboxylating nicotinate-nucleotide diphosphorylase [Limisalsivibrio acetivorans]
MLINGYTKRLIQLALDEDIGTGDLTATAFESFKTQATFSFIAKQDCIICGTKVAKEVYYTLDPVVNVEFFVEDGERITERKVIGQVTGPASSILTGERTALNFIQRLTGVATNTARYVEALSDTNIKILDTRKTTPGWRRLEKYAVKTGGGWNHRLGLFDGVMLKDNHIDAAGSITKAVANVRRFIPTTVKVEIETRNLEEVREAVEAGADIIMLDNFKRETIQDAIDIIDGKAKVEVSGGISLEYLPKLKGMAIDYISIGALTHQAVGVDISLKMRG